MRDQIKSTIEFVKKQYNLCQYKTGRAIIQTPFGQKHYDEGVQRLSDSKAVAKLAKQGFILCFIITSKKTKIGFLPDWITCIRVSKVPDWPEHPAYQNRFFKWAIPFLFPNIKTSLYLDSDLIISNKLEKLLHVFEVVEQHEYLMTRHVIRKGWEDEYEAILNWRCLDWEKLRRQHDLLMKEGVPKEGLVFENNFIGRSHNSKLNALCFEVLSQLAEFSERDQLGFVYACHKCGISPFSLDEGEILYAGFSKSINYNQVTFVEPWAISKMKCDSSEL